MKQKYLAVALSAALVASLTACGSDSKSNYAPSNPPPTDIPKDEPKPKDDKPKDEPKKEEKVQVQEKFNYNEVALGGNPASVVTNGAQQNVFGIQSDVALLAQPVANTDDPQKIGNSASFSFRNLTNPSMSGVVVGRSTEDREQNNVVVVVGNIPGVNQERLGHQYDNSLQALNKTDARFGVITDNHKISSSGKAHIITGTNGEVGIGSSSSNNFSVYDNGLHTMTARPNLKDRNAVAIFTTGSEDTLVDGSVRVLGAYHRQGIFGQAPTNPAYRSNAFENNIRVDVARMLTPNNSNSVPGITTSIQEVAGRLRGLSNAQFGRVTVNLNDVNALKTSDATNRGTYNYFETNANRPTFLGNKSDEETTDVYFYRGNNPTENRPTTGTASYVGQALMYGVNNSFVPGASNTTVPLDVSNAPVGNAGYQDMIGSFVKATADFGTGKLNGNVYNIWRTTPNARGNARLVENNVVDFSGDLVGPNTVLGKAELTYDRASKADFQASFYGNKAQELGGSFNSVQRKADQTGTRGVSEWGGVFGATQIDLGNIHQEN